MRHDLDVELKSLIETRTNYEIYIKHQLGIRTIFMYTIRAMIIIKKLQAHAQTHMDIRIRSRVSSFLHFPADTE